MTPFEQLHPALQHHIVNTLGWRQLRAVQERAIEQVFAGRNLVVLAPTAGGKTEAAFFPLLSRTLTENWTGLSVLYLSPIKALLNNQLERLQRYYGLVGRQADLWHGDVTAGRKRVMAGEPPDCLLTTPESLEVMLVSGNVRHERLFADVRAVVIDEVHAFAADDRGWHLLALLGRIGRLAGRDLVRIGLSATVGNPDELLDWLAAGSSRAGQVLRPEEESGLARPEVTLDHVGSLDNAGRVIAALHRSEKRLVFCDSRSRVEQLAAALRGLGVRTFVSHSSLSLDERRQAEQAFAEGRDCVIVATSALELGIDVGDLDRVIQIDAPPTVSAFLQRMGRTGRRPGSTRNCLLLATSDDGLLRAAGLLRLWESGFVEPVHPPVRPSHILAQQLMALALQERGIGRSEWFSWLEGVSAFRAIGRVGREEIVSWMLDQAILWDDEGLLWLGHKGQDTYGRKNFLELFSVFTAPPEFAVRHGLQELGFVHETTFLGRRDGGAPLILLLAGRSWRLTHLDWGRRVAQVEPSDEGGRSRWRGAGQPLSFALCQAVRETLAEDGTPACWSRRARSRLGEVRDEYDWLDGRTGSVLVADRAGLEWWTFAGGKANACLATGLGAVLDTTATWDNFAVRIAGEHTIEDAERGLAELRRRGAEAILPAVNEEAARGLKFSACLPGPLATGILQSRLADPEGIRAVLEQPVRLVSAG